MGNLDAHWENQDILLIISINSQKWQHFFYVKVIGVGKHRTRETQKLGKYFFETNIFFLRIWFFLLRSILCELNQDYFLC